MKQLTLIKLGGSIITNKEVPMMVREDILAQLIKEIGKAQKETGQQYIVGHGQGSFAHAPALRYKTMDGFVKKDSVMGMAITQDSAAQLNRIVVREFMREQIPAVSFLFSNSLITKNRKPSHWCGQVLEEYLEKGLLPITGGDVIVDQEQGCTIWSTEEVLSHIAQSLTNKDYTISSIVHVTEVEGVIDSQNQVIPFVSEENKSQVKKMINGTKGFDVTGGMWHKVEESLQLAKLGVSSIILSGMKKNNLYNCLTHKSWSGTEIK